MPISTSGLSVPQVSTNYDSSIYGNKDMPKAMTIADMLDINKKQLDLQKATETYGPEVAKTKSEAKRLEAESQNAQQIAQQNALKTVKAHVSNIAQGTAELSTDPDLTPEKILKKYNEINAAAPGDAASKAAALQQVVAGMPQKMPSETDDQFQTRLQTFVAVNHLKGLDHLAAVQQAYPGTANVSTGGQTVNVSTGNPLLTGQAPGTPTGAYLQNTLAPTVAVSPTGGPMAFGGGGVPQAGNLNNRPREVQVAPAGGGATATGMQQTAPKTNAPQGGGVTAQSMNQPKGGSSAVPYIQGEPYDAFRTRAGDVAKMIPSAQKALNINEPDAIPNAIYTNEKIQKLLEDKNLNIGPIANAIANNTGGVGLDAKQDEIRKYLEQRIRMESARSNSDQASQRTAFGSFGTNREALKQILYKDNGSLAGQELYQRGLLNHAGDVNKPNLQSVNKFNNDYAKIADPKVVHLIGVIGDKSIKDLSQSDKKHLAKEFPNMSVEQFQKLLDKRQQLIELVGK